MASNATAVRTQANGVIAPLPADDEEQMYMELVRLRDAVLAGTHPQIKLPPSVVAQLKAALAASNETLPQADGLVNGVPEHSTSHSADYVQPSTAPSVPAEQITNGTAHSAPGFAQAHLPKPIIPGLLPGLSSALPPSPWPGVQPASSAPSAANGLNPIFLEKSEQLVRAENRLKRQRLERELQNQVDNRKSSARDRDSVVEAPSTLDIAAVLAKSQMREEHLSGFKSAHAVRSRAASLQSSFDENDYYSSQVESEWSSPVSANRHSDRAPAASLSKTTQAGLSSSSERPDAMSSVTQPKTSRRAVDIIELDNEDDEYTPPDADAFDDVYEPNGDDDMADDESEYEPGEIQETNVNSSFGATNASPQVPVIRNHLTHIAAPQPNRVSPLAVAKVPSMGELQLVNGRPEFVSGLNSRPFAMQYDGSADDSNGRDAVGSGKKATSKKTKRKRDTEEKQHETTKGDRKRAKMLQKREQRKLERQQEKRRKSNNAAYSPVTPNSQPYIKEEPASPSSQLSRVPVAHGFPHTPQYVDLASPGRGPAIHILDDSPNRYPPRSLQRAASPATHRPLQRDTQDLRRVASMHYAQRPRSPERIHSPAPVTQYRNVSMPYSDLRVSHAPRDIAETARYEEGYAQTAPPRSPPRDLDSRDAYRPRVQDLALVPPSAPPTGQIFVDQYGNQYYMDVAPPAPPRASVAPVEHYGPAETGYARAPSRISSSAYGQANPPRYETTHQAMPPPPLPVRATTSHGMRTDYGVYPAAEQIARPAERDVRYMQDTASPVYQQAPSHNPYTRPAAGEATSPVYAAPPRSYSVRDEEHPAPRSRDVAPVQYIEGPRASVAPIRALSVAPGHEAAQQAAQVFYPREESMRAPSLSTHATNGMPGHMSGHNDAFSAYDPYARQDTIRQAPAFSRATSVIPGYTVVDHASFPLRQDMPPPSMPPRATSVVPGHDPSSRVQMIDGRAYASMYGARDAAQYVRYVDQNGAAVYPGQERAPTSEYRYQ